MTAIKPSEPEASDHEWGESRPMAVAVAAPESGVSYVAEGEVVAGKYRVERVLGVGGMAFVLSAKHVHLDEHFALKFLNREFLAQKPIVERFTREAKAACKIRSEHVARVYDVGLHHGAPFLVMEHLNGRDLAAVVVQEGALPIAEACEYTMQACVALAVAHSHGIVHRDIKPENLFLIEHEGMPVIKLLDFGISKAALTGADPRGQLTGQLTLGTPCYMSPEQIRSTASADARSDQWSIGVVLYELLAGIEAFQAETVTEVCAAVLEREPWPLAELRPDLPQALIEVVVRCMAKEPSLRFDDVAELAEALLPFAPSRALVSVERASSILHAARRMASGEHPISLVRPAATHPTSREVLRAGRVSAAPLSRSLEPSVSELSVSASPPRRRGRAMLLALAAVMLAGGVAYRARQVSAAEPAHAERATAAPLSPAQDPPLAATPIATHAVPSAVEAPEDGSPRARPGAPWAAAVPARAAAAPRAPLAGRPVAAASATGSSTAASTATAAPSVELGY